MEKEEVSGMAKVYKDSIPIKIQKFKYEIVELEKKLTSLEAAIGAKTGKGVLAYFRRKKLPGLDKMIAQTKTQIEKMSGEWIEGVMTPLSVRERFVCLNEQATHRFVMTEKLAGDKTLTQARKKAYERTIDLTCDMIYRVAWVSQTLKKRVQDGLVQMFSFEEACNIHPQLILELNGIHDREFVLGDEELKK